jgi:hypothetical protein
MGNYMDASSEPIGRAKATLKSFFAGHQGQKLHLHI